MRAFGIVSLAVWGLLACKKDKEPEEEKPIEIKQIIDCQNTCVFAKDGECDDGGPGSTSELCSLGMDCADCGERIIIEVK